MMRRRWDGSGDPLKFAMAGVNDGTSRCTCSQGGSHARGKRLQNKARSLVRLPQMHLDTLIMMPNARMTSAIRTASFACAGRANTT